MGSDSHPRDTTRLTATATVTPAKIALNDSSAAKEELSILQRHDQHIPQCLFEQVFGFSPIRSLLFQCAFSASAGFPKAISDGIDDFLIVRVVHAFN
jgi:hypothetical protein